jgi:hypothetical protein
MTAKAPLVASAALPNEAADPHSMECNGHGVMQGGKCFCDMGYLGSQCSYKEITDIDYHGSDISTGVITCPDAACCADQCDAYPDQACKMWVWWDMTRYYPGRCWLKAVIPEEVHDEQHVISGLPVNLSPGGLIDISRVKFFCIHS